jgi:hypothetical protein
MADGHAPRVRVVILNYDGGDMTLRCLEALREVDWPADSLRSLATTRRSTGSCR